MVAIAANEDGYREVLDTVLKDRKKIRLDAKASFSGYIFHILDGVNLRIPRWGKLQIPWYVGGYESSVR